MENNDSLDVSDVFFEALDYPEFARPNFFAIKQKESKWTKGVYLTALSEYYHICIQSFHMRYGVKKRNQENLKIENLKITLKELRGIESEKQISLESLEQLYFSIQDAWLIDKKQKLFTPYEIISILETSLVFIWNEYNKKIKSNFTTKEILSGANINYGSYLIAADGPFFDFPVIKNAIRELLYCSRNLEEFTTLLNTLYKLSSEIVKLWNKEIYFIETKVNKNKLKIEIARVEFYSNTLRYSWWVDTKLFDNKPHNNFSNEDLATFASKIANFINNEIIHKTTIKVKKIEKDFLNDFIEGIKDLEDQNNSHYAIKNIIDGNNHEKDFRDFFKTWFSARGYHADSESLRGNNHIDLKIQHHLINKKIIEFKGWWNNDKKAIIKQLFNYLSSFEGEGYIFIINHTRNSVINQYKKIIIDKSNEYIDDSWNDLTYDKTPFHYYKSEHEFFEGHRKLIYHFILDIQKPNKVHSKSKNKLSSSKW